MYRGHDGMRQYFDDVQKVWKKLRVDPREFRAIADRVVAVGRVSGDRDGNRVDSQAAWAWKLRDGKVVWGRVYENPAGAFVDAGFDPSDST
jgi:ketosteroid isomerase-like protein